MERLASDSPARDELVQAMLDALPERMVALDDLPGDLTERYLATDGRARVEVFAETSRRRRLPTPLSYAAKTASPAAREVFAERSRRRRRPTPRAHGADAASRRRLGLMQIRLERVAQVG